MCRHKNTCENAPAQARQRVSIDLSLPVYGGLPSCARLLVKAPGCLLRWNGWVRSIEAVRGQRLEVAETSAAEGPLRGRLGGRSADRRPTIERERFKSTHDGLSTLHEAVTWQKRWTPPVGTHDNDSRTPTGNW